MLKKFLLYCYAFVIGAVIYSVIEVATKGNTHWSMTLTGGTVMAVIHYVNTHLKSNSLLKRCILGAVIITAFELFVGITVNIIFKLNVWDYSDKPLNFMGQICPYFSCTWFLLSIPAFLISTLIYNKITDRY